MAPPWKITGLVPESDLRHCLPKILATRNKEMFSYADAIIERDAPECVHDMRVAARRLLATLKLYRKLFSPEDFKAVYRPLKGLVRSLGDVRELDVFLGALDQYRLGIGDNDRIALDLVFARSDARRVLSRKKLKRTLKSLAGSRFERAIDRLAKKPFRKDKKEIYQQSFRDDARQSLPTLFDRFFGALEPVMENPGLTEEFHRLRLAGKPLRYAMEMFSQAFGRSFARCLEQIKSILEIMGSIHECDVAMVLAGETLMELQEFNRSSAVRVQIESILAFMSHSRGLRDAQFKELRTVCRRSSRSDLRGQLIRSMGKHN